MIKPFPRKSESEVAKSCQTVCDPMDCSLPGSSIHRIFQARVLEWVAISFKKCKKEKWLSEEALQIAEQRREVKGKGEREQYTQLNEEFQRIATRDKKAFLSE